MLNDKKYSEELESYAQEHSELLRSFTDKVFLDSGAASNISPVDYETKPIDTIKTNIFGTDVLCDYAVKHHAKRFLFCSSVETYGRSNGDVDASTVDYSGYADSNTVRANYPASKRCSEALCDAYAAEHPGFDFVVARIGRFYGPNRSVERQSFTLTAGSHAL